MTPELKGIYSVALAVVEDLRSDDVDVERATAIFEGLDTALACLRLSAEQEKPAAEGEKGSRVGGGATS
jgi:hypothetical protein